MHPALRIVRPCADAVESVESWAPRTLDDDAF